MGWGLMCRAGRGLRPSPKALQTPDPPRGAPSGASWTGGCAALREGSIVLALSLTEKGNMGTFTFVAHGPQKSYPLPCAQPRARRGGVQSFVCVVADPC